MSTTIYLFNIYKYKERKRIIKNSIQSSLDFVNKFYYRNLFIRILFFKNNLTPILFNPCQTPILKEFKS